MPTIRKPFGICFSTRVTLGSFHEDGRTRTFARRFRPCTKFSKECRPSCIVYRFSQPATGQTFYVQVFDKNYSVAVDDLSRQLVLKIVALVENFAVNPGDQTNRFLQRFENFSRRATRPWARRRRFCAFWNKRGLPIPRPSLRVTNDNSPTSRPTALSFAGSGSGSTMQLKQACHMPFSRLRLRVLI